MLALLCLMLLPLITALLCRVLPGTAWAERANLIGAAATLVAGLAVAAQVVTAGPLTALGGALFVDALGALLLAVVVTVAFLAAIYSTGYLRHDVAAGTVPAAQVGWYYAGFHGFVWTMLLTAVVNNLGLLWVAVEATTVVSALLVGFYRTPAALEAAWKYLILCSVGIVFALFGVLLTYYAATHALGPEAGLEWTSLMARARELDPGVMKLAFVFVFIGFGAKAGFAPLHTWLPDAHSQAPAPVSAVLSAVLLNCALYAIVRFHLLASATLGPEFSSGLLLAFGLFSVAFVIPFLLVQRDFKRLLAYSSVEHIGITAAAIGLGGPLGITAALLHLVNHALAKALLFFVAGELTTRYGTRRIAAIRGALLATPLAGPLLLLGGFAITGLPPFGIFVSEVSIVHAGFQSGYGIAAAALALLLALAFAGIFSHVAAMAFGRPERAVPAGHTGRLGVAALLLPAAGITVMGIQIPPAVAAALQAAASVLTGGGL